MSTQGYGRGRETPGPGSGPGPFTPRLPPEIEEPSDEEMETTATAAAASEETPDEIAQVLVKALTRLTNEQAASQKNIQDLTAAIGPLAGLRAHSPQRTGTTKATKVVKVDCHNSCFSYQLTR